MLVDCGEESLPGRYLPYLLYLPSTPFRTGLNSPGRALEATNKMKQYGKEDVVKLPEHGPVLSRLQNLYGVPVWRRCVEDNNATVPDQAMNPRPP